MSRLTRYTQSIFGSSATNNQIAEFGSLAASSPQRYSGSTITPAIVQNLSNYLSGWFSAVIGQASPAIEDMNALCYLFAYQLTYLMQAGVPEWDSGTTYYTGDLVQVSGINYVSIQDSNLNNNPTSAGTYWTQPTQNGIITSNSLSKSITIPSGQTLSWPNLTINTADTLTIASGAYLLGFNFITVNGTLTINGSCTIK